MNRADLYLAPVPKELVFDDGIFDLTKNRYVQLDSEDPQSLISAVEQTGLKWEITVSPKVPNEMLGMVICHDESSDIPAEGYDLTINPDLIKISASTPAGAFYGACTLAQIIRQLVNNIPCMSIKDWPDFTDRGVMLDISRDKVPTMETLYHLIDLLAEWKINQFQLYTEHTFKYLAHPKVWENATPITGEEILALDAYCKTKFIELVPNQNSFGHMERWLTHDEYRPMAESPYGGENAWGRRDYPFSLSPVDERSIPFVDGLFEELLPHFSSTLFNVGCDETIDLGYGRSKQLCEERGIGRVYIDFLMDIYKLTENYDRMMMFWGDIIIHYPDLIDELPKNAIALEWGYESDHPFKEHGAKFKDADIPFYVCPGASNWNTLAGRTENAIGNITSAAKSGLENGAIGLLNTSWGDNGHWDPMPVAYLGFLVGAMASWNADADVKKDIQQNLSLHAFGDKTGKIGQTFYELGNIYQLFKKKTFNSSVPWQVLFNPEFDIDGLEIGEFEEMQRKLDDIAAASQDDAMNVNDADILRFELHFIFSILKFAAEVGKMKLGGAEIEDIECRIEKLRNEHRHVWLLRNRPGGLEDSAAKLKI